MPVTRRKSRDNLIIPEGVDVSEWGVLPTAQTKTKHRKTSFAKMCDAREIDGTMLRAAQEIGEVYDAICRGMMGKSSWNLERVDGSRNTNIADKIAWAHKSRYKPWADELSRRHKRGGPPALETVFEVVIDGMRLRDVDKARRWRRHFGKYLVRRSLLEYAVMARWADAQELSDFDKGHLEFSRRLIAA